MPIAFTDRLNVEFQKAGTRGLSLFFATGDDGASGITCRYGNCSIFNPTFPPSSPCVVAPKLCCGWLPLRGAHTVRAWRCGVAGTSSPLAARSGAGQTAPRASPQPQRSRRTR